MCSLTAEQFSTLTVLDCFVSLMFWLSFIVKPTISSIKATMVLVENHKKRELLLKVAIGWGELSFSSVSSPECAIFSALQGFDFYFLKTPTIALK